MSMLSRFVKALPAFGRRWNALQFANPNFVRIPSTQIFEEENFVDYMASRYYPATIGQVIQDRYQIVGKLGFGAYSTVWLARDLVGRRHVVLKLFITSSSIGEHVHNEANMYARISQNWSNHPGSRVVRALLADFYLEGPHGEHRCLVHEPLSESVIHFLHRNPIGRLPSILVAVTLRRIFEALDFLHTKCHIIHTDIKADNVMFGIRGKSVFREFEELEMKQPCARKILNDRTIYESRPLSMDAKGLELPILCDLGSAVFGDVEHLEDIQPDVYRSPEVILEVPWTYSADIWNVGCMVWDIFEGGHLFYGHDDELQKYRGRAHLADIVALLGPPPAALLARGRYTHKFFHEDGTFRDDVPHRDSVPLEDRETTLEGEDKAAFLRLMRKMLQWEPEKRATAAELIKDEWISTHCRD